MIEEWKNITDWEAMYMVSDMGRVKSLKYGKERILTPVIRAGYPCVSFSRNNVIYHSTIHRLVMFEFEGPAPYGLDEIDHLNGNKLDSRLLNLQYVSSSENKKRAFRLGLMKAKKGEGHPLAKLKEENVLDIFRSSTTPNELAEKYKVSAATVNDIKRGERWGHLTGKKYEKQNVKRLKEEEVVAIFYENGTYRGLGKKYGVAFSVIQEIKKGTSHKKITKTLKTS